MNKIDMNNMLAQMRIAAAAAQGPQAVAKPAQDNNFADVFANAVSKVNDLQANAKALTTDFETGAKDVQLSDVMVAVQKSGIAFQAMTEVRNKLVSAYQEIMSMPI